MYRLLRHLPSSVKTIVITPSANTPSDRPASGIESEQVAVRYAPRRWQVLAHHGGGIPAALSANRWLYLLLPSLLLCMFAACLRRARRIDLFHAHWSINGAICGLAGKLTRKPVITTLRGSDVNLATRSSLHRLILRCCVQLSHKIVAVDHSLIGTVRELNPDQPKTKFNTIANGVDERYFDIERRISSTAELITVGNLTPNKDVASILQALHVLSDRQVRLTVVGDGPEKENLIKLAAALKLERQVEFAGRVAPDKVADYLSRSDIFVLASHSEGRPNSVVEAMASGVPVVARDIPGVRALVVPNVMGLLFDDTAGTNLADCLAELLRQPELRYEMGVNARRFIASKGFHWRDAAEQYYRLYREMTTDKSLHREQ